MKSFASDNNAGIHPQILQKIEKANYGDAIGYGADEHTEEAIKLFKQQFGNNAETYFVFNGTGANVLAIQACNQTHQAVICSETAHINVDECGAPEKITGSKIIPIKHTNGKIKISDIEPHLSSFGFEHHVQPHLISISNVTELGTVYTCEEIKLLADFAHRNKMLLHIDGARIANAAAFLNVSLKQMITDCGVDVLSFGGTKNGLMIGEAVVFLNQPLSENFKYKRKQSTQLASKMRFIAAQFCGIFENNLWLKNAQIANEMTQILAKKIKEIKSFEIVYPIESNAIFVKIPKHITEPLRKKYFFYIWNDAENIVRWMTAFNTKEEEINEFVAYIKSLL